MQASHRVKKDQEQEVRAIEDRLRLQEKYRVIASQPDSPSKLKALKHFYYVEAVAVLSNTQFKRTLKYIWFHIETIEKKLGDGA